MKDKGKYGGQMWKYLQNLSSEGILTNQEVASLCNLSRSWPKAFMVDYFTNPLKDGEAADETEIGKELMDRLQSQI